ncbi:MAG: hypothetical protein AB1454_04040 [Candidatus Auribacterota bacterium]
MALPGFLLTIITSGRFIQQLVIYTSGEFVANPVVFRIVLDLFLEMIPFIVAVCLVFIMQIKKIRFNQLWTVLLIYYIISLCSISLIFIEGAWDQYLVEFATLTVVCGSISFAHILSILKPSLKWIAIFMFCVSMLFSFVMPWYRDDRSNMKTLRNFRLIFEQKALAHFEIIERIKSVHGRVLCQHINYNILAGKNPEWNPLMSKRLAERNILSNQQIINDIHKKRFDLIVLDIYINPIKRELIANPVYMDLLPDALLQAILINYTVIPDKSHIPRSAKNEEKKTIFYPKP